MKDQASLEGRNKKEGFKPTDTNNFPISSLLRHIALTHNIINELDTDKFSIKVYHSGLLFLQSKLGKMKVLEDR